MCTSPVLTTTTTGSFGVSSTPKPTDITRVSPDTSVCSSASVHGEDSASVVNFTELLKQNEQVSAQPEEEIPTVSAPVNLTTSDASLPILLTNDCHFLAMIRS